MMIVAPFITTSQDIFILYRIPLFNYNSLFAIFKPSKPVVLNLVL